MAEAIQREIGLSGRDSSDLVEGILHHLCAALSTEGSVKITNFGSFTVREKKARVGRNPKTGEAHPIAPRRVLTFRPSTNFRERLRQGH